MAEVTDKESLAFWGVKLGNPKQPFNSLRRRQILEQLKKQFGINPLDWKCDFKTGEGHWHSGVSNEDRVENDSGYIVDKKGKKLSFCVDWESSCEATPEKFAACSHRTPKECGIKFYVAELSRTFYESSGKLRNNKYYSKGKPIF